MSASTPTPSQPTSAVSRLSQRDLDEVLAQMDRMEQGGTLEFALSNESYLATPTPTISTARSAGAASSSSSARSPQSAQSAQSARGPVRSAGVRQYVARSRMGQGPYQSTAASIASTAAAAAVGAGAPARRTAATWRNPLRRAGVEPGARTQALRDLRAIGMVPRTAGGRQARTAQMQTTLQAFNVHELSQGMSDADILDHYRQLQQQSSALDEAAAAEANLSDAEDFEGDEDEDFYFGETIEGSLDRAPTPSDEED
jgi:uncharacterized protein (DUF433 family)